MKRFETMINTCDDSLGEELIDPEAAFFTPASDKPLCGPQGYLSVVRFMRQSFSMAFGEIATNNDQLISLLVEYMENDCRMKDEYRRRADDFFAFNDHNNCQRIYDVMLDYSRKEI